MSIVFVGVDLAKNVFAVHGVDEAGKPALVRLSVACAKLHDLIAGVPPCTVAMEACTGAHHWARLFAAHSHSVRLIAPKFVTPYRMSGARGNDARAGQLMILGARSVLALAKGRSDSTSSWALAVQQRRGYWKAVVAIAAKNARLCWAVLRRGENFKLPT